MQCFTHGQRRPSTAMILSGVLLLLSLTLIGTAAAQSNGLQAALGTTFTYQGRLLDSGIPATGTYDLQFTLYDALSAGTQIGPVVTKDDVQVSDGYFTTLLDFGNVFNGTALFMQIDVRPGSSTGSYTALSPRVSLTAAPFAHYALNNWGLTGNGGLNSSNYLGTRDNLTLTLSVSGTAALRLVPRFDSWAGFAPNVIGGSNANFITPTAPALTVIGATIAGGGSTAAPNLVGADYATVGGGSYNAARSLGDTVSGGYHNTASGGWATVSGGNLNTASGNTAIVGGGIGNLASGNDTFIGGGVYNQASEHYAIVVGGDGNIASGGAATVVGGETNTASGNFTFVGGGSSNVAAMQYGSISGGYSNTITTGADYSTIAGGSNNTASGYIATVAGGLSNVAQGSTSFAAGYRAKANHNGTFVWGDSTAFSDVASTAANQFIARASGGVTFYTTGNLSTGVTVAAGSGSWSSVSDRNVKANFAAIDPRDVLQRLAQVPISTWNYKAQATTIRHIGPMAQDFAAAFGVGEDDTHISTIDADGVSLAAIQGLYQISQEKDQQIAQLQARLEKLESHASPIGSAAPTGLIWFIAGAVIGLGAFWLGSRRVKTIG